MSNRLQWILTMSFIVCIIQELTVAEIRRYSSSPPKSSPITMMIRSKKVAAKSQLKKSTYRYRPQFSSCYQTSITDSSIGSSSGGNNKQDDRYSSTSKCKYLYKYVLLLSNSFYTEALKECSNSRRIRHLIQLNRELANLSRQINTVAANDDNDDDDAIDVGGNFVTIHVAGERYDTIMYAILSDIIIGALGNVSIYTEDWHRYYDVLRHCNRLSNKCNNLKNLLIVNAQIRQQDDIRRDSSSSSLLEMYDSRWIPATSEDSDLPDMAAAADVAAAKQAKSLSASDKEIRSLALSICGRDRRYNFYYEFCPDSIYTLYDGNYRDPDYMRKGAFQETSLSLQDILPTNPKFYDKNRPPKVDGQATVVFFHVTVLSLDSINEESMTYVADIFLAQSWRDQRLRLPENMWEEYRILNVDWLHDIWKPDCFFKNAKQVTFHEISVPNHYLWLYHDKTLLYMSKLSLVLSCAMKFESYPHDTQACSMLIESLSHTTHDLVFKWNSTDPLVLNAEIELPQLDIVHNYTSDCTIHYSTGNFTCLAVVFSLQRRLGYHLFHTYIPSALIVVMSWISFWIKPEAIPARVTLGVTSLLTLATQNTQSQQSLPPVSYVKAIDIWMSSCSVFVFLSLMEFAVVNNYMGPVATKAMKGYSDEDIMLSEDTKTFGSRHLSPSRSIAANMPQYVTFCNGRAVAVYIDKFSRFFFPFSFLVLNLVYWTSFL